MVSTDVFLLDKQQRRITLLLWSQSLHAFDKDTAMTWTPRFTAASASSAVITNVVPCDMNKDGQLDVLVYYRDSASSDPVTAPVHMQLYLGRNATHLETGTSSFDSMPMSMGPRRDRSVAFHRNPNRLGRCRVSAHAT